MSSSATPTKMAAVAVPWRIAGGVGGLFRRQEGALRSHVMWGKNTHGTRRQSQARMGCAARSRQGLAERVSEQRAHSIGSAAAAALVAPLVRVLSSAISSTMCAASENTAAVTMPARWWER